MPVLRSARSAFSPSDFAGIVDNCAGDVINGIFPVPEPRYCPEALRIKTEPIDETLLEQNLSFPSESPPPYRLKDPRKSHSRRKEEGHIPRPPNAFLIYRSELCASGKIKSSVENKHGEISRVAGHLWRQLPPEQRAIYDRKAEEEKAKHLKLYPGYKYSPTTKRKSVVKKKRNMPSVVGDDDRCKLMAQLLLQGAEGEQLEMALNKMKEISEAQSQSSSARRSTNVKSTNPTRLVANHSRTTRSQCDSFPSPEQHSETLSDVSACSPTDSEFQVEALFPLEGSSSYSTPVFSPNTYYSESYPPAPQYDPTLAFLNASSPPHTYTDLTGTAIHGYEYDYYSSDGMMLYDNLEDANFLMLGNISNLNNFDIPASAYFTQESNIASGF